MFVGQKTRTFIIALLLALGTALLYGPAITFDYIHFDDPRYVFGNPHVLNGWSWHSFLWSFQAGYACNWHPLTWWSHILDCQLFGTKAGYHHLTNVLLHTLNSVLLFLLLKRTTNTFWRSAMVAALFAWHPCHVESVAWISERKDVLSTFFFLLTLGAYHRYTIAKAAILAPGTATTRPALFYSAALVFYALGLMAKPMLVTLPFVLLLLDWWPLGRLEQNIRQKLKPLILEKIPFLLLAAVSSVITIFAQTQGGAVSSLSHIPFYMRITNPLLSYLRYVEKLVWPADLSLLYPFEMPWSGGELALAAAFMALGSWAAWRMRSRLPWFSVGWLWYLGTLLPVIGVLQVGQQAMADRYTYIPFIGLFVAICWGAYHLACRWQQHRLALGLTAAAVLTATCAVAGQQIQHWRNGEAIFSHSIKVTPNNYVLRTSLGSYYLEHQQFEKARLQLEEALRLAPRYFVANHMLGEVFGALGKTDQAAEQFEKAIAGKPDSAEPRIELAKILLGKNRPSDAIEHLVVALQTDPGHPGIRFLLGRACVMQGKLPEAEEQFRVVLQLRPTEPDTHCELAAVLSAQLRAKEAVEHYRKALEARPDFPTALNNLAWIRAAHSDSTLRNGPEAVQLATRACALTRDAEPIMIGTLAAAYAEAGRFEEATAAAQKAHDLAKKTGLADLAARNLELLEFYRAKRPFHEPAPQASADATHR